MSEKYIQKKNPLSHKWVKINKKKGTVIGHNDEKYEGISLGGDIGDKELLKLYFNASRNEESGDIFIENKELGVVIFIKKNDGIISFLSKPGSFKVYYKI